MIDVSMVACLTLLIVVLFGLTRLHSQLNKLSRVEAKIDLLLEHAGLKYDPFANVCASVSMALQCGKKIEAIKHYRAATGAGLKEAKEFVEELERRASFSSRR